MDWQTKEYIDERFNDLEDKIDLLLKHFALDQDKEEMDLGEDLPESEEINI